MSIRDTQREIRKGNFVKGAVSSKTALTARPKGVAGGAGAVVGKYPKSVAAGGALTLVALGVGGTKAIEAHRNPKKKIGKADTRLRDQISNEDKASLAIGGGVGAALMPMRAPKARDGRKDQIAQLKADVEAAGGKPGQAVDIDLNPNVATRISEKSGVRAQNRSYTHNKAANQQFAPDKKYHIAMYGDDGVRQAGGKHYLAAQAIKGEDVKARVHMMEGSRPAEPTAVQALMRPVKGHLERKALAAEVASPQAAIQRKASRYRSSGINAQIARVADKEGELRIKPGLSAQDVKRLHTKQAAYVAGGAGTLYVGNKVLRGEKNGPTKAITGTSTKISDTTRNKVASVVAPTERKEISKGLPKGLRAVAVKPEELGEQPTRQQLVNHYIERRQSGRLAGKIAAKHVKYSRDPKMTSDLHAMSSRMAGHAMNIGEHTRTQSRAAQELLTPDPEMFKRPMAWDRTVTKRLVRKRDDNKDRYVAAGVGTAAGAAAMPVRDAGGRADRKFAEKYGHLKSGEHHIPSKDLQNIAAPGRRPNNRGYTLKGAQSIVEGKWNPDPITVRVYDDAGKTAGGAHRTQARAFAQEANQKVNIERIQGAYPRTRPGIESAVYRARRVIQPARFKSWTPGSKAELKAEADKIPQSVVDNALKHATDSPHKDLGPGLTKEGMKALKHKQGAFLAGGTAAAVGANELRRNHNTNIGKKWEVEAGRNDRWIRSKGEQRAVLHDPLYLGGAATSLGGAGVAAHRVMRGNPKTAVPMAISIAGGATGIVGAHSAANRWRRSQGLTNRNIVTGAPQSVGKAAPRPDYIAKKRPAGSPNAFLHPIKRAKWGVNQGIANAANSAGQNFTQGAVDAAKANVPAGAADALKGAAGHGGKVAGAGLVGAGLLAGAAKIGGDVMQSRAAQKAAIESTKRARLYTAGGVGGAGLIGGGFALNRRKSGN